MREGQERGKRGQEGRQEGDTGGVGREAGDVVCAHDLAAALLPRGCGAVRRGCDAVVVGQARPSLRGRCQLAGGCATRVRRALDHPRSSSQSLHKARSMRSMGLCRSIDRSREQPGPTQPNALSNVIVQRPSTWIMAGAGRAAVVAQRAGTRRSRRSCAGAGTASAAAKRPGRSCATETRRTCTRTRRSRSRSPAVGCPVAARAPQPHEEERISPGLHSSAGTSKDRRHTLGL